MIEELARQLTLYDGCGGVLLHHLRALGLEDLLYRLHLPASNVLLAAWDQGSEVGLYVVVAVSVLLKLHRYFPLAEPLAGATHHAGWTVGTAQPCF